MSFFRYTGRSKNGRKIKGEIDALSLALAKKELQEHGYYSLKIKPVPKDLLENTFLEKGVSEQELAVFSRQFATMIGAGVSILSSLRLLTRQSNNKKLQRTLLAVRLHIEHGSSLFEALSLYPDVFSPLYVNMVRAGELGGVIDRVLLLLCGYLEKSVALKSRIKNALMYPLIVLLVASGVLGFVLLYVVPSFEEMFSQSGQTLPLATQIVLQCSHFLQAYFLYFVVSLSGILVLFFLFGKTRIGRHFFDRLKLVLPVYGQIYVKGITARFSRMLGSMLSCGVTLLTALEVVAAVVENSLIEELVQESTALVARGESFGTSLFEVGVFPLMFVSMVEVGEKSGTLDSTLLKLADFFDEEVKNAVANGVALLEPCLLVGIGGLVGGLIVALYLPVFQMGTFV